MTTIFVCRDRILTEIAISKPVWAETMGCWCVVNSLRIGAEIFPDIEPGECVEFELTEVRRFKGGEEAGR